MSSFLSQVAGQEHEELARLICIELNDAWSDFEEKGMQNMF